MFQGKTIYEGDKRISCLKCSGLEQVYFRKEPNWRINSTYNALLILEFVLADASLLKACGTDFMQQKWDQTCFFMHLCTYVL